jgi:S1-C subfamily serine protease
VIPLKIGMLPGDDMGHAASGWLCGDRKPMQANDTALKALGQMINILVTQELRRLGYPLAGLGKANAFDTDLSAAPDFRIGGILKEARFEVCNQAPNGGSEGWIYFKIDWALYSERLQKVVFQQHTEGLAQSKDKVPDLPKRAVLSNFANFLAAPELLQALKANAAPTPAAAAASAGAPEAAMATPAGTGLTLKAGIAPGGGAQKNQARLRAAVVQLETAEGKGSGFYMGRDGYLLTNAHVVKGAKYVKVRMDNGDKLVAEVVKVHEQVDVALLKSAAVEVEPLALRSNSLDVGEEVYAIGSPLGVLTNSMTCGVLSADRNIQGRRVLQSDAAVTFGSSGGPLLDADGRVIAITRGGLPANAGFNFFIPIQDALKAMDLTVK